MADPICSPNYFSHIFGNLYTAVDGIFVARFVDTDALSAINISMPMAYLASAVGMMFGTGGNALIAKKLGEGKHQEALEDFSLLMVVAFLFSFVLSALCFIFLDPLCRFLGSDESILFNRILMNLGGSDGVASLSIIWYAQGLFGSLFRGYVNGISSVVSYNLGRSDKGRLSRLFRISVWILLVASAAVTVISYLLGGTVVNFFAKGNEHVATISLHGFRIVATSFIMMAVNMFASGWFTALNDGKTSTILSFCRMIIFMVIPVLVVCFLTDLHGLCQNRHLLVNPWLRNFRIAWRLMRFYDNLFLYVLTEHLDSTPQIRRIVHASRHDQSRFRPSRA